MLDREMTVFLQYFQQALEAMINSDEFILVLLDQLFGEFTTITPCVVLPYDTDEPSGHYRLDIDIGNLLTKQFIELLLKREKIIIHIQHTLLIQPGFKLLQQQRRNLWDFWLSGIHLSRAAPLKLQLGKIRLTHQFSDMLDDPTDIPLFKQWL
ncbi:MAG: hypothetical protein QNJ78_06110 [Gammaproteobacteria bacterium]|nr:hypothetical protein [Gammaproteobacteria bacterium]